MLLYAMAKDIIVLGEANGVAHDDAGLTHLQPLSSAPLANGASGANGVHGVNGEIDVDIDLDIFGGDAFEKPQAVLSQAPIVANSGSIDFDSATASEFGKFRSR